MKRILFVTLLIMATSLMAYAVNSDKPSTHDTTWIERHGNASKIDKEECLQCHVEEVSCIKCHQDTPPRDHTPGWVKKGHGLEARWDSESCSSCHREDTCITCHQETPPASHRPGWREPLNRHCGSSCHYPIQETTCYTCHKSAHAPNQYNN